MMNLDPNTTIRSIRKIEKQERKKKGCKEKITRKIEFQIPTSEI